jgi:hypothetical protein
MLIALQKITSAEADIVNNLRHEFLVNFLTKVYIYASLFYYYN